MIVNERLTSYLHSLDRGNGELLDRIEAEAVRDFVPIIRKETGALLKNAGGFKAAQGDSGGGNGGGLFRPSDGPGDACWLPSHHHRKV